MDLTRSCRSVLRFETGTTFSLEYLRNGDGYSDAEAEQAFELYDTAIGPGAASLPGDTVNRLASILFESQRKNCTMGRISYNTLFEKVIF